MPLLPIFNNLLPSPARGSVVRCDGTTLWRHRHSNISLGIGISKTYGSEEDVVRIDVGMLRCGVWLSDVDVRGVGGGDV